MICFDNRDFREFLELAGRILSTFKTSALTGTRFDDKYILKLKSIEVEAHIIHPAIKLALPGIYLLQRFPRGYDQLMHRPIGL